MTVFSSFSLPGTTECPSNPKFVLEYSGYLMSNYYHGGYYKGEYICVDRQAKARSNSPTSSNQGRLYPTETQCGTLPCGPYTGNREVSCSVCSTQMLGGKASVFTDWGRKSCPQETEKVYEGYAAASYYSHEGSGANMVCLTSQPRYHQYSDGDHNGALLYGVVYSINLPSYGSIGGHRVPCSVCLTDSASTIMVPGRLDCPSDWSLQYPGYLAASYYSHKSKINWECVDESSESGGSSSSNAYLYQTEIECGSIKCRNQEDRYVQNREVTCAVCSPPASRRGIVFTRWGRSVCPSGSRLVYSGFAAGSLYSQPGSGANVLCMRQVPTYGEFYAGNNEGARLYGYEYTSGGLRSTEFTSLSSHEVVVMRSAWCGGVMTGLCTMCRCRVLCARKTTLLQRTLCLVAMSVHTNTWLPTVAMHLAITTVTLPKDSLFVSISSLKVTTTRLAGQVTVRQSCIQLRWNVGACLALPTIRTEK